jgi:hypothetical protein
MYSTDEMMSIFEEYETRNMSRMMKNQLVIKAHRHKYKTYMEEMLICVRNQQAERDIEDDEDLNRYKYVLNRISNRLSVVCSPDICIVPTLKPNVSNISHQVEALVSMLDKYHLKKSYMIENAYGQYDYDKVVIDLREYSNNIEQICLILDNHTNHVICVDTKHHTGYNTYVNFRPMSSNITYNVFTSFFYLSSLLSGIHTSVHPSIKPSRDTNYEWQDFALGNPDSYAAVDFYDMCIDTFIVKTVGAFIASRPTEKMTIVELSCGEGRVVHKTMVEYNSHILEYIAFEYEHALVNETVRKVDPYSWKHKCTIVENDASKKCMYNEDFTYEFQHELHNIDIFIASGSILTSGVGASTISIHDKKDIFRKFIQNCKIGACIILTGWEKNVVVDEKLFLELGLEVTNWSIPGVHAFCYFESGIILIEFIILKKVKASVYM